MSGELISMQLWRVRVSMKYAPIIYNMNNQLDAHIRHGAGDQLIYRTNNAVDRNIYLVSLTVSVSTQRASCRDLSASSRRWLEAPRRMMEQADPLLQPENRIKRSSPT